MALLPVGPDSEGMIVSPIGFVIDEGCLVCSRHISSLAVVVATAIEELALSVRERLSELLPSNVDIGVEIDMPQTHARGESETQRDCPNVVITRDVVEETF